LTAVIFAGNRYRFLEDVSMGSTHHALNLFESKGVFGIEPVSDIFQPGTELLFEAEDTGTQFGMSSLGIGNGFRMILGLL